MQTITSILLKLHVIAGFLSLVLFWIPLFTKKGGINHVKIGKAYLFLMWLVVISAALLSIKNIIIGDMISAAFLGFLTFITANPLWHGIAILNHKKGLTPSFRKKHLFFEMLVFIGGVLLLAYGIYLKGKGAGVLMIIFGLLGISNIRQIITQIKNPPQKANWFNEHVAGMLTTGIAAYTAFFAFGGRAFMGNIFTGMWMIIPWVAPTVIGTFAIIYLRKYYDQKRKVAKVVSVE
jgi:hypothetical protein